MKYFKRMFWKRRMFPLEGRMEKAYVITCIIKGDTAGYFMTNATIVAQTSASYGMATREAAIPMNMRTYYAIN